MQRSYGEGPYTRPLRVLVVTQHDPFYVPWFFREFGRLYRCGGDRFADVAGVMVQPPLGTRGPLDLARRVWSLYGAVGFVRTAIRYAAAGAGARRRSAWRHTIEWYCEAAGVPIVALPPERSVRPDRTVNDRVPPRANNVNGAGFHRLIAEEEIDLIVSVSASQVFGGRTLSAPTIGCINLHNAPLPDYRGMLPNFWQLYHGEEKSVLTIHTMAPQIDRGEILARSELSLADNPSLEWLMAEAKRRSAAVLWELLEAIHAGIARTEPIPETEGSYFTWPTRSEAREFVRRGHRVW